jgi:hypothetical protein
MCSSGKVLSAGRDVTYWQDDVEGMQRLCYKLMAMKLITSRF